MPYVLYFVCSLFLKLCTHDRMISSPVLPFMYQKYLDCYFRRVFWRSSNISKHFLEKETKSSMFLAESFYRMYNVTWLPDQSSASFDNVVALYLDLRRYILNKNCHGNRTL